MLTNAGWGRAGAASAPGWSASTRGWVPRHPLPFAGRPPVRPMPSWLLGRRSPLPLPRCLPPCQRRLPRPRHLRRADRCVLHRALFTVQVLSGASAPSGMEGRGWGRPAASPARSRRCPAPWPRGRGPRPPAPPAPACTGPPADHPPRPSSASAALGGRARCARRGRTTAQRGPASTAPPASPRTRWAVTALLYGM
jgi:hypothetical protein